MADDREVHTVTEVIVCHVGGLLHRVCKNVPTASRQWLTVLV